MPRAWPTRRYGSAPVAADSSPDSLACPGRRDSPAAMLTRAARGMAGGTGDDDLVGFHGRFWGTSPRAPLPRHTKEKAAYHPHPLMAGLELI